MARPNTPWWRFRCGDLMAGLHSQQPRRIRYMRPFRRAPHLGRRRTAQALGGGNDGAAAQGEYASRCGALATWIPYLPEK